MKYELSPFDYPHFLSEEIEKIADKVPDIIAEIKATAFSLKSKEELKIYIRNHQTALLNFKKQQQLSKSSDSILYFIETHFPNFLSTSKSVSDMAKYQLFNQYKKEIEVLNDLWRAKCSSRLLEAINIFISFHLQTDLTVLQFRYLQFIIPEIIELSNSNMESYQEKLTNALIKFNFNTLSFAQFITANTSDIYLPIARWLAQKFSCTLLELLSRLLKKLLN